jgi:hypothetical protein
MEKGLKNLFTAARNRKGSRQHYSPGVSHHSDEHFDDSGLGDLDSRRNSLQPSGLAPSPSQVNNSNHHAPVSDSSNHHNRHFSTSHIANTLAATQQHSRSSSSSFSHGHHNALMNNSLPYFTSSPPAFPISLPAYTMPPPTASSLPSSSLSMHPQTLPSISRNFDISLPPMTSLMSRHGTQMIGASYA